MFHLAKLGPSFYGRIWTSGMYDTSTDRFAWCDNGEMISRKTNWKWDQPSHGTAENCVSLNYVDKQLEQTNYGLADELCDVKALYICEVYYVI